MRAVAVNRRFGIAWVMFALAVAVHVTDEATHDFLSTYNSSVRTMRARLPFLPLPTFSFRVWLALLITGIFLLLCLSPFGFSWKLLAANHLSPLRHSCGTAQCHSSHRQFHLFSPLDARCVQFAFPPVCGHLSPREFAGS